MVLRITETSTEQPPATDQVSTPDEEIVPTEGTASAETVDSAETVNVQPDSTPADTPSPSPRLQPPSLTDLRTAVRNRAEQDRQSRSTHPDCLTRERRNDYLDCGDEQVYDFASAGQNATVAFFTPTLPNEPDNGSEERTSTGARVRAAIDMVDNQLGTTQTKKRLMNIP